jgi:hypothetical protein
VTSAGPRLAAGDTINNVGIMAISRLPGILGHFAIALLWTSTAAAGQERPLPDPKPFLDDVRIHLRRDEELQSGYVYVETRRELKLDKSMRATKETASVIESYPGLPGEERWERVISEDGKPVPPAELEKRDRERQKKAEAYVRRLATQTEKDREKQRREHEKQRREETEIIDEIFRVYDVRLLRREQLEGHDTIVCALTPRPGVKPRTRDGKIMQKFIGTAWISEADRELVRLQVEAIDTVSIGMGLLARVHKGTRASFQRRKVNGEAWLPASWDYSASARVMLLKTFRVGGTSEFSGYRKFTVDTATTYTNPK